MTSFCFPKTLLCFRVRVKVRVSVRFRIRVRVKVRIRVSRNTFKNVFGQTFIRVKITGLLSISFFVYAKLQFNFNKCSVDAKPFIEKNSMNRLSTAVIKA